ncbi:MAG: hypothetical protein QM501_00575, partial [Gimesia sp.]
MLTENSIAGDKYDCIRVVILLLMFSGVLNIVQAKSPELMLKIEGLDNAYLEEVASGDYQIIIDGNPLERISRAEFPALRELEINLQDKKQTKAQSERKLNALLIAMA